MRINQLNSYSNIQPSDTLLISNNSIDYQCTVQDLISNALILPNLVIGTDTSPVDITASKITVNSIIVQ